MDLYAELDKIARDVQTDVEEMVKDLGRDADTSYDLWIMNDGALRCTYGVIDMGDCYQCVYTIIDGKWEPDHRFDPGRTIDKIIRTRQELGSY